VYANASIIENYMEDLRMKTGEITTYEDLKAIFWQAACLDLSKNVSHQIALISPGAFRHTAVVEALFCISENFYCNQKKPMSSC
jgi:hypothetical protein